jgi:hypothetical protein
MDVRLWLRTQLRMPFTIGSATLAALLLTLAQTIEQRPTFLVFGSISGAAMLLVLGEIAMVVMEEWREWLTRGFATLTVRRPRRSVLTGPLAVFDLYFAMALTYALVGMAPWLYDESANKSAYYRGFDVADGGIGERTPWLVFFHFLSTSFMVQNGVGFAGSTPTRWFIDALFGSLSVIANLYNITIVSLLCNTYYARNHDGMDDSHVHDIESQQQQQQQQMMMNSSYNTLAYAGNNGYCANVVIGEQYSDTGGFVPVYHTNAAAAAAAYQASDAATALGATGFYGTPKTHHL